MSRRGKSIPELIGFSPIPAQRRRAYSAESYQAQYLLTKQEAESLLADFSADESARNRAHPAINNALTQRYNTDREYRARIDAARARLGAKELDD